MITERTLTESEQTRMTELEFYLFVENLLRVYNRSYAVADVMETLASLFNCSITTIKKLTQQVYAGYGSFIPSKQELIVVLYKNQMPIRTIRRLTSIHPQTVYSNLDAWQEAGCPEYFAKLDAHEYEEVETFMENVKRITEWR